MMEQLILPPSTELALKCYIDYILNIISPKLRKLCEISENVSNTEFDNKKANLFLLCKDQLFKCTGLMTEIFKNEISNNTILEDSRNWILSRMALCLEKLETVQKLNTNTIKLNTSLTDNNTENLMDLDTVMSDGFISWIDDLLELLITFEKLFEYNSNETLKYNKYDKWISECSSSLLGYHKIVRELILSAINISQNCLMDDQKIINARCHVILRESKNLMAEISNNSQFIIGECQEFDEKHLKIKKNIHFPTVRIFIDVVKDAAHNLEMSINKAVLNLVLKCLINPCDSLITLKNSQPITSLTEYNLIFKENSDCVKEFDLHNDRIIQIGLFAISCSADEQRVLQLKSFLASLEILEAHLVPAILLNCESFHAKFLMKHWCEEVQSLKKSVFLIIDPSAFINLAIEQFRDIFITIKKSQNLSEVLVKSLIDLGKCVVDYISVYFDCEPQVFQRHSLLPQVFNDLKKVVKECVAVYNLFFKLDIEENFYEEKMKKNKERLLKRLKLLYSKLFTITKMFVINNQSENNESDDSTISFNDSLQMQEKATNIHVSKKVKGIFKIFDIFRGSLETLENLNDSNNSNHKRNKDSNKTFSRSTIIRKRNLPQLGFQNMQSPPVCSISHILNRLNKIDENHRKISLNNLTVNLDSISNEFLLTNVSEICTEQNNDENVCQSLFKNDDHNVTNIKNMLCSDIVSKNRINRSLRRKALFNRAMEHDKLNPDKNIEVTEESKPLCVQDDTLDLHVTDILEQLTTLSDTISLLKVNHTRDDKFLKYKASNNLYEKKVLGNSSSNLLTLKINQTIDVTPKKVWNIQIGNEKENLKNEGNTLHENIKLKEHNISTVTTPNTVNIDCGIDISFGSDIATPERLNDLHMLEEKLLQLKQFWNKTKKL